MNRIVEKFAQLKRDGRKGFIVYIGAGDPNVATTPESLKLLPVMANRDP